MTTVESAVVLKLRTVLGSSGANPSTNRYHTGNRPNTGGIREGGAAQWADAAWFRGLEGVTCGFRGAQVARELKSRPRAAAPRESGVPFSVRPPVREITPSATRSAVAWPIASRFVWGPACGGAERASAFRGPGQLHLDCRLNRVWCCSLAGRSQNSREHESIQTANRPVGERLRRSPTRVAYA
jgi:hypothetical protein